KKSNKRFTQNKEKHTLQKVYKKKNYLQKHPTILHVLKSFHHSLICNSLEYIFLDKTN
ncbi:unnamed protein product, partial [Arabidopsis halleri]